MTAVTSDRGLTPKAALARLDELSPGVAAAVLFEPSGVPAAMTGAAEPRRLRQLAGRIMENADAAAPAGEPVSQVEVATRGGAVYGLRDRGWTLIAVTVKPVLASLMFLDLLSVVKSLTAEAA